LFKELNTIKKYTIHGGKRLCGTVHISGAKNAALAVIPAAVLCDEPCVIGNVPDIKDVTSMLDIMRELGATVEYQGNGSYFIDPQTISNHNVSYSHAREIRASFYYLGALLGKFHEGKVSMPGGCNFCDRPIDLHIKAFEILGAECKLHSGAYLATCNVLEGREIYFDVVSVGATVNAILAAVKAKGTTVIKNAAKEPQIIDLANFLSLMGAQIFGAGTDTIKVIGVRYLKSCEYEIIPDQIEAGTYLLAGAVTGGDVTVTGIIPKHLEAITNKLTKMGLDLHIEDESVRIISKDEIKAIDIKTSPHPGFPTDMGPQFQVLMCKADGVSIFRENVWFSRFSHIEEYKRMGAKIKAEGDTAVIEGAAMLTGAKVVATDLRAGAGLVLMGLCGTGTTEIYDAYKIERGYEDIIGKLRQLGGDISEEFENAKNSEEIVAV
jgi:UDP-N-acetylglucosamine 1-carboxyvinyltransferase